MCQVLKAPECPACSGRGKGGKRVWMHLTRWRDADNHETRIDALCPRCLWVRIVHVASGLVQEGRGRKLTYARNG